MTFASIIVTLIIGAIFWWLAGASPLPQPWKGWVQWVIVAAVLLSLLFGIFGHGAGFLHQRIGG